MRKKGFAHIQMGKNEKKLHYSQNLWSYKQRWKVGQFGNLRISPPEMVLWIQPCIKLEKSQLKFWGSFELKNVAWRKFGREVQSIMNMVIKIGKKYSSEGSIRISKGLKIYFNHSLFISSLQQFYQKFSS